MWFTCHRPIASPLVQLNAKHINLIKVMLYRLWFQRSWGRWWTAIKTLTHAYSNCWHLITPVRTPHLDKNLGTSSSISCVLHVLRTVWGDCLPETKEKQNCRVFFVVFMSKLLIVRVISPDILSKHQSHLLAMLEPWIQVSHFLRWFAHICTCAHSNVPSCMHFCNGVKLTRHMFLNKYVTICNIHRLFVHFN